MHSVKKVLVNPLYTYDWKDGGELLDYEVRCSVYNLASEIQNIIEFSLCRTIEVELQSFTPEWGGEEK